MSGFVRPEVCKAGHEQTPETVYVRANGATECRACQAERRRKARQPKPLTLTNLSAEAASGLAGAFHALTAAIGGAK